MHNTCYDRIDPFAPDIVNSLTNTPLEAAIRAMLYSPNERNQDGFIRILLSSTLIALTEVPPIPPHGQPLNLDEEGFGYYGKNTQIPLVQFKTELDSLILPVFTQSLFVHRIKGLSMFHGLALPALTLFEMCLVAGSEKVIFNPESPDSIEFGRDFVTVIVTELRSLGLLDNSEALVNHGTTAWIQTV